MISLDLMKSSEIRIAGDLNLPYFGTNFVQNAGALWCHFERVECLAEIGSDMAEDGWWGSSLRHFVIVNVVCRKTWAEIEHRKIIFETETPQVVESYLVEHFSIREIEEYNV